MQEGEEAEVCVALKFEDHLGGKPHRVKLPKRPCLAHTTAGLYQWQKGSMINKNKTEAASRPIMKKQLISIVPKFFNWKWFYQI